MIDPGASIGAVHLTIADLDRSVRFYETRLGFITHHRDARTARLRADAGVDDVLVLTRSETATRASGTTGLYHFAIPVPTRGDLARSFRRPIETRTGMQGAADHGVSEALYLADPDGNGIEIYRDRPREEWPFSAGRLRMTTEALAVDDLRAEAGTAGGEQLPRGTIIGHVHLHVARALAAATACVRAVGLPLEGADSGLLVRDPSNNAVVFRVS
ncbi:MAG: VOC family protein [Acidobacteriia bacterium]|nr:VOC family protein [Terriglobia bacterium]